jgi:hypothetical protein
MRLSSELIDSERNCFVSLSPNKVINGALALELAYITDH